MFDMFDPCAGRFELFTNLMQDPRTITINKVGKPGGFGMLSRAHSFYKLFAIRHPVEKAATAFS
jgi:hypothetical protein